MNKLTPQLQTHYNRIKLSQPRLQQLHYTTTLTSSNKSHYQSLSEEDITLTKAYLISIKSNPFLSYLRLCKTLYSLEKLHALFITHGQSSGLTLQTKLVSLYSHLGDIQTARLVFDQMPDPDLLSCKVMIRWYFMNDLNFETIGFYHRMRKCIKEHDNVVFSIVLKACIGLRDFKEGRKVHCHMVKVGGLDSFVMTVLVDMYAKYGDVKCAREVFDDILDRDVVCWTSMIVGYVQNGCPEEGLRLFSRMRNGSVQGNQYTFGTVVMACTTLGAFHQGKWVHGFVIKNGSDINSHLITSFLDMYAKCGKICDARSIFDELSTVDLVSWTAMISKYNQSGYPNEALALFTNTKWIDIVPNLVTMTSVISACAQSANIVVGRPVHGLGIKLSLEDATVESALIDMYARCQLIGDARYLFEGVSNKNVITWNSIISAYVHNGFVNEAMRLFQRMRSEDYCPDAVTLVTVLSACTSIGAFQAGSCFHAYSIKEGLISSNNVYIGTALLDFYAKCGELRSSRAIFDGMEEKNTISWNALITGYGNQGDCSGYRAIFDDMMKENLHLNDATFTAILSACSHTGMVEQGWRYFDLMCRRFNFVPSMKHYVCMVDLLARDGRLEEASEFIEKMPIRPDVGLFGAFIHGCKLHSRFDLGEKAARRMLELHPNNSCYYVLMANLYASDGRWSQAYQLRETMKIREMRKLPGCSQVRMDNGRDLSRPRATFCS